MSFSRRIDRDIMEMHSHPEFGISLGDTTNKRSFQAFLTGPEGTPYHTGLFVLDVRMPQDYPMSPPKIYFETACFHPNIGPGSGRVCVDVLDVEDNWIPALTLKQTLEMVQGLLANPNPFSPLNDLAADMLRRNKDLFEKSARAVTFYRAGGTIVDNETKEQVEECSIRWGVQAAEAVDRLVRMRWTV